MNGTKYVFNNILKDLMKHRRYLRSKIDSIGKKDLRPHIELARTNREIEMFSKKLHESLYGRNSTPFSNMFTKKAVEISTITKPIEKMISERRRLSDVLNKKTVLSKWMNPWNVINSPFIDKKIRAYKAAIKALKDTTEDRLERLVTNHPSIKKLKDAHLEQLNRENPLSIDKHPYTPRQFRVKFDKHDAIASKYFELRDKYKNKWKEKLIDEMRRIK